MPKQCYKPAIQLQVRIIIKLLAPYKNSKANLCFMCRILMVVSKVALRTLSATPTPSQKHLTDP